jgi:hypothetical protein
MRTASDRRDVNSVAAFGADWNSIQGRGRLSIRRQFPTYPPAGRGTGATGGRAARAACAHPQTEFVSRRGARDVFSDEQDLDSVDYFGLLTGGLRTTHRCRTGGEYAEQDIVTSDSLMPSCREALARVILT